MSYIVKLISNNRPRTPLKPSGVVVHETANHGGTAQDHYNYWNSAYHGSSAHAVIDSGDIIQLIPYNEQSWHAGKTANSKYIGVELCRPAVHDAEKFHEVWTNGVNLFADILIEQVGTTTVTKDNLRSHAEVAQENHETNHTDPVGYFAEYGLTVDDFRWAVQQRIDELIKPQILSLTDAVNVLVSKGIVNAPDYWVQNAVKGKAVNGEYTGLLIQRVAEKLK